MSKNSFSNMPNHLHKFARKLAFSKFVEARQYSPCTTGPTCEGSGSQDSGHDKVQWKCCSTDFTSIRDFHRHCAIHHQSDVESSTEEILSKGCKDARWKLLQFGANGHLVEGPLSEEPANGENVESTLPSVIESSANFPWLPSAVDDSKRLQDSTEYNSEGQILLFYKYRRIHNTKHVRNWQEELCRRLELTGKVRIASEGINATVGGSKIHTEIYMCCIMKHPLFSDMTDLDFKQSPGSSQAFPDGLKVGVYEEIVPMGIRPKDLSPEDTGKHVSPAEFHTAMEEYISSENGSNKVFIDCRNFYESKIGQFKGALCPDIRKFSYWPEYVDKNKAVFENKEVYMYCTGGIRCERGSAYLRKKGICDKVYQLDGGIHKYIEQYPDGHFRGKLFVFDDRYHIQANSDVISKCHYCYQPWDHYQPCTSPHCHQLVLSCPKCREDNRTACCTTCQGQAHVPKSSVKEECECTQNRNRIPIETPE